MASINDLEADPEYEEYLIPERRLSLSMLALLVLLAEFIFPGFHAWFFYGVKDAFVDTAIASVHEILFLILLVLVHEGIHTLTTISLGYRPDFGIKFFDSIWFIKEPSPYIVVLGEFLSRRDNILMLATPFIILTPLALVGLLPVFPSWITYFSKIVLVVNTAASVGDLYNVARVLKMPRETRFINFQNGKLRTFYTVPE